MYRLRILQVSLAVVTALFILPGCKKFFPGKLPPSVTTCGYPFKLNSSGTIALSTPPYFSASTQDIIAFVGADDVNVNILNVSNNTWTTGSLSLSRVSVATGGVDQKLFFAGGVNDGEIRNVYFWPGVDIYNETSSSWSTASLSEGRNSLAAGSAGHVIAFGGGYHDPYSNLDDLSDRVDFYDNSLNTWTTGSLSQRRTLLAGTGTGNKILFGGGMGPGGVSSTVDIYDIVSKTWNVANLSGARENLGAAASCGKVLFAGGYNSSGPSATVDIYDVATNSWSVSKLSHPREYCYGVAAGNKIIFGTSLYDKTASDYDLDVYDIIKGKWSVINLTGARITGSAALNKFVFGGGDLQADVFTLQ